MACQAYGGAIKIPDHCQHGKKLTNCHVAHCITAHITDHNNVGIFQLMPHKADAKAINQQNPQKEHAVVT
ncbi:uncharacterized protein A1O9_12362 [Exophiala aquamarina CBS 119918]|uniref:Uncharacterized protein n=1 Tax=Exophiala aquamarina CBS 119918 TaxID=1182545 RepID=A0A072P769_9EURO|nr:uncharacterized protein A1O9_12362 [Exophiala aquamarina CBS 119918]KEF51445.1 hypothetical protein A1O9_12362 [Exophiala aquamarina CBS 119918]